ncbi:MAG: hypothetical protein U0521_02270 [Anaerolineae bacterium]
MAIARRPSSSSTAFCSSAPVSPRCPIDAICDGAPKIIDASESG